VQIFKANSSEISHATAVSYCKRIDNVNNSLKVKNKSHILARTLADGWNSQVKTNVSYKQIMRSS